MLVNTSGQWAIHCNQGILSNLNPLLTSLQIWLYDNLQNVSDLYLTKVDIIWMCLDACKLHSSTEWPIKPMSLIYHFDNFLSITNSAWISWVFLSRFHVNQCRTHWDMGQLVTGIRNCPKQIRAFGTAICCKLHVRISNVSTIHGVNTHIESDGQIHLVDDCACHGEGWKAIPLWILVVADAIFDN